MSLLISRGMADSHLPPIDISVHTYCISGIQTHIYGLDQLRPYLTPSSQLTSLSILHTLHPRLQSHTYMSPVIKETLTDHYFPATNPSSKLIELTSGLLGISFDQRNHSSREVEPLANLAFRSPPPPHPNHHADNNTHAMDMLGIYAGSTMDLSLIIELLPAYLEFHFNPPSAEPESESELNPISLPPIKTQIALGVSLGGHAAYLAALHLPLITDAIVVIGCPDYPTLMLHRLKQSKLLSKSASSSSSSSTLSTPYLPPTFLTLISNPTSPTTSFLKSPHITPLHSLKGKHLLILSGKEDKLVPAEFSKEFIARVRREIESVSGVLFKTGAGIRELVYEGVGHDFTDEMKLEVRAFVKQRVRLREVGSGLVL